jgi:hypothetical protein
MDEHNSPLALTQAEQQVAHAKRQVERQQAIVSQLRSQGHGAERASKLLAELKKLLAIQIAERDRILQGRTGLAPRELAEDGAK